MDYRPIYPLDYRRSYEHCLARASAYFSEAIRLRAYRPELALCYTMEEIQLEELPDRLESTLALLAIARTAISYGASLSEVSDFMDDLRNLLRALPARACEIEGLGVAAHERTAVAADVHRVLVAAGLSQDANPEVHLAPRNRAAPAD